MLVKIFNKRIKLLASKEVYTKERIEANFQGVGGKFAT